eukprot:277787-Prymnesium_polylepis.1
MAGEGVDGAWFQASALAGATATSGDGGGLLQAPRGNASDVATGDAMVGAPGGAARDAADDMACDRAPPPPCAVVASAVAAAAVAPGEEATEHDEQDERPSRAEPRVAAAAEPHKRRA